jgi:VCBS repeat-containing protein
MATNTSGGTTTSFTKTPQASDDIFWFDEDDLAGQTALLMDVMSDDLGGKSKILWSIDDGSNDTGAMNDYVAGDLLTQDQLTSGVSAWQQTDQGNWIRINNGQVEYRLGNGTNANPDNYPPVSFETLPEGMFTDTFVYAIRMANGTLSWATVTVNIEGSNDAPEVDATDPVGFTEAADASAQDLSDSGTVSFNDIDTTDVVDITFASNGDIAWSGGTIDPLLAAQLVAGFNTGATDAAAPGSTPWTYSVNDASLDFLAAGETITFSYTVTATDNNGDTATDTVSFTITGTNDAPTMSATAAAAIVEDADASAQDLSDSGTVNFDDVDATDVVDISYASNNNIVWSGGTIDAALAAQLVNGFSVTTVVDAAAPGSTPWTYSVNDANLDFLAAGQTITFSYTVTATDNNGATAADTVSFTITGTNDAPVAVADTNSGDAVSEAGVNPGSTAFPGDGTASGNVLANDTDTDNGATLNVAEVNGAAANVGIAVTGTYGSVIIGSDGTYTYTLDNSDTDTTELYQGQEVTDTFSYTVTDEHGATSTANLVITITGTNDKPTAVGDVASVDEDDTTSGTVAANDGDVDTGADLTFALVNPAPTGLTFNDDGSWSFDASSYDDLSEDEPLELVIPYTVTDEFGASATSNLTITVTGVNDAAEIGGTLSGDITEDEVPNFITGTAAAADVDNTPDTFVADSGDTTYGSFTINEAGEWKYTLNNSNATVQALTAASIPLVDSFTIESEDGTTETVSIQIFGADEIVGFAKPTKYDGLDAVNDHDSDLGTGTPSNPLLPGATEGGDTLDGRTNGSGADTINALGGDDIVNAGAGGDNVYGGSGSDTIYGGDNNDLIFGQAGGDFLYGQDNNDTIYGGSGNDLIDGGNVADALLNGGSGDDTILGGVGADTIIGGYGADLLTGGGDNDIFRYLDKLDTNDTITDFRAAGAGLDQLDLNGIDANEGTVGNQDFGWNGDNGALAHSLWYEISGANTILFGDTDGNLATAEFMITLSNFTGFAAYENPVNVPPTTLLDG